jgi:hypothetical protein
MKIKKIVRDQLVDIRNKFDPVKVRKLKSLKEIKSKPLRITLISFIVLISIVFTYIALVKQEDFSEREFKDNFIKTELKLDENKVYNWNLIKRFQYKDSFAKLYQYQTDDGLEFILIDHKNNQILYRTTIDTVKKEPKSDDPIALFQLLIWLNENNKESKFDDFYFEDNFWVINNKKYSVELRYGQLFSVNNDELSLYPNIFLTQPAQRRLLKSFNKKPSEMRIGRVTIQDDQLLITARKKDTGDDEPVYELHSSKSGEVEVIENQITLKK